MKVGDLLVLCDRRTGAVKDNGVIIEVGIKPEISGVSVADRFIKIFWSVEQKYVKWHESNILFFNKEDEKGNEYIEVIES